MKPPDPQHHLRSLLRYLLIRSPFYAEMHSAQNALLKDAPRDRWIQVHNGGHTGWVHLSKSGSGRYQSTKPQVPDQEIQVVKVRPGPFFELRKEYEEAVARLPNGAARHEYERMLPRLYEMGNGVFEKEMRDHFLDGCFADLKLKSLGASFNGEKLFIEALPDAHKRFGVPGYAVGQLTALHRGWNGHSDAILNDMKTGNVPVTTLEDLLRYAFLHVVKKSGAAPLEKAAESLHDDGQASLDLANNETDERFYELISEAGWQFYGAWVTYQYLSTLGSLPEAERQRFHGLYAACEEFHVACLTPISTALDNARTSYRPLANHALGIAEIHAQDGKAAAETRLDELIHHQRLYPPSYRKMIRELAYDMMAGSGLLGALKRLRWRLFGYP